MTRPIFDTDKKRVARLSPRPKDAATLLIVRRDKDAPRVLMGQRHADMAFVPNKFVFPGGRVDPCDRRITAGGELRADVAAKLANGATPAGARGLALAAIRETFEETGVLIGEHAASPRRTRAPAWRRFFALGVVPRLDRLDFIARAITPPGNTRRFDTRFFMVDASAIAATVEATHAGELLEPTWLTFAEARALDLVGITRYALAEAEARISDGAPRPVLFFRYAHGKRRIIYL